MSATPADLRARSSTASPAAPVLVVGDVMLDHFLIGRVNRISPEAPVRSSASITRVPPRRRRQRRAQRRGARRQRRRSSAWSATTTPAATLLREPGARRASARRGLITDPSTAARRARCASSPTRNQQVARIDYESDGEVGRRRRGRAGRARCAIARAGAGVVVRLGLPEGRGHAAVDRAVGDRARARRAACRCWSIPKVPHIDYYARRGAGHAEPPRGRERRRNMRIRTADEAPRRRRERSASGSACDERADHARRARHVAARRRRREGSPAGGGARGADVTGAGDTVIATLALALAAGATLPRRRAWPTRRRHRRRQVRAGRPSRWKILLRRRLDSGARYLLRTVELQGVKGW